MYTPNMHTRIFATFLMTAVALFENTQVTAQGTVVRNECFSPGCKIEQNNLVNCLSGDWNCSDNEYCEVQYSGQFTWLCSPRPHVTMCEQGSYNRCPPAYSPAYHPRQVCYYCCDDAACMFNYIHTYPTTAPTQAICVQCGDYDIGIPCSESDLLFDTPTPCVIPGQTFCMTDTSTDSDGVLSIYKRCVDQPTCESLWYLGSRESLACCNFDSATVDTYCHFCCIGDGCNMATIPPENTLYTNSVGK